MNKHAVWTLFTVLALAILRLAACSGGEGTCSNSHFGRQTWYVFFGSGKCGAQDHSVQRSSVACGARNLSGLFIFRIAEAHAPRLTSQPKSCILNAIRQSRRNHVSGFGTRWSMGRLQLFGVGYGDHTVQRNQRLGSLTIR